jgi:hypothetical protein
MQVFINWTICSSTGVFYSPTGLKKESYSKPDFEGIEWLLCFDYRILLCRFQHRSIQKWLK